MLFIGGSVTFHIIVANMAIAVACDTYDRVSSENREILSLKSKVAFLADYVFDWVGGRLVGGKRGRDRYRYMYNIEKIDEGQIEHLWKGKIKMYQ